MKNDIKNSQGKVIGFTEIKEDCVIIHNNTKPEYIINDKSVVDLIIKKDKSEKFLLTLYDNYYLTCGEIASMYGVCYSNINKIIKRLNTKTAAHEGRRNRSYGKQQSVLTKQKISEKIKDAYKNGVYDDVQPYKRTEEIKNKISNSLKNYFKEHPQNPEPHRNNWKNGIYDKVDFHRGIGGHFYSSKNQKIIYFRSLLELAFMLILENEADVLTYEYESLTIQCENGSLYIPDIKINDTIIELKSYKYVHSNEEILNKFLYKQEQGKKYCLTHGLKYKVIYDIDFKFYSAQMKRHLNNHNEILDKYQIVFNEPHRMVIK